ncbi:MAG: dTDP-glucose 4,6-dehydratase [Proteobacteria bacterium]|nr:dTDP-glucose 4,6-dehydratase [Pseudomonadota bacterium]
MRILVTGGAGFIGSHMTCRLLDEGCHVLNVDKLTYAGSLENLGSHLNHPKHRFEKADICDLPKMAALFNDFKPDRILHMAAESHVDRSIDAPQIFIQTNVIGTQNLLLAGLDYWRKLPQDAQDSFRFIHLSTDEVFGALGKDGFFNENSPYRPNSPYAASKASSDLLARSYWKTFDFPVVIMNSSNNYGPRQYPEKLIPLMILNALEEKSLPIYGKGYQMRDWLFVEDHVEALWIALNKAAPGETYCVGGGNDFSNIDLVHALCGILDEMQPRKSGKPYRDLISFVEDRPGHDFRYAIDAGKMKRDLGWRPKADFASGLRTTVTWYLSRQKGLAAIPARERRGKA